MYKNYHSNYGNNTYYHSENKKPEEKPEVKKLRYDSDTMTREKDGKTIKLTFTNGTTMTGVLKNFGMYDLLLKIQDKEIIVMKSQIMFVEVL